jgi:general secretion pathway protein K
MTRRSFRSTRSSVIVIVLVTILFTAIALTAFIEKASNDLLVEARAASAARLRQDAYSALEVTLAVLEDFRQADNGLHSPNEGWTDPLNWAGWSPPDGETFEVSFVDESGKISLAQTDITTLTNLFESWQMIPSDSENLADAIIGWMKNGYTYTTALTPDYEQSAIPFDSPGRSLRSFSELAAIDVVKQSFFDDSGRPNDKWWRFVADTSLYKFPRTNINGANADVLAAVGQFTDTQQQKLGDYLAGVGSYAQNEGPQWFQNTSTAATVAGLGGAASSFATTISALRVKITVHEGSTIFRLEAVVAPQGGATIVTTTATSPNANATASTATTTSSSVTSQATPSSTATSQQTANAANTNIQYPFTLLEIRENDEILTPPPPPPPTTT